MDERWNNNKYIHSIRNASHGYDRIYEHKLDFDDCLKSYHEAVSGLPTLQSLIDENQKDRDAFDFNVRRFGDFFSFEISRTYAIVGTEYEKFGSKEDQCFAVKCENGTNVRLHPGIVCGVNRTSIKCSVSRHYNDDGSHEKWGFHWTHKPPSRSILEQDRRCFDYQCDAVSIPDFPYYAVDDAISIGGFGFISVPQGLGDMVYRKILKAAEH